MVKFIFLLLFLGLSVQAAYDSACNPQVKKITQSSSCSVLPDIIIQGREVLYGVTPFLQKLISDYGKRAPQVFELSNFYGISSFIISEINTLQWPNRLDVLKFKLTPNLGGTFFAD